MRGQGGDEVRQWGEWAAGNNIRWPGEDVRPGALLVPAGTELGPAEIALLAATGVHPARGHRRPRVTILATGARLVPPAEPPAPGQLRESHSPYVAARVTCPG